MKPGAKTPAAPAPVMNASTLTCSGGWARASVARVAAAAVAAPRKCRRETSRGESSWTGCVGGRPSASALMSPSSTLGRPGSGRNGSEAATPDQAYHHEAEEQQSDGGGNERAPVAQSGRALVRRLGPCSALGEEHP